MATLSRALVLLLSLTLAGCTLQAQDAPHRKAAPAKNAPVVDFDAPNGSIGHVLTIKRVVDGDTLVLSNNEKVRLIGVDTPEFHASKKQRQDAERTKRDVKTIKELGRQASAFTKTVASGKPVKLEFDDTNKRTNHRDRYGRLLAYVYFLEGWDEEWPDGVPPELRHLESTKEGFLNGMVIEAGYGHAYTRYPFKHRDDFVEYERDARKAERGLWKE